MLGTIIFVFLFIVVIVSSLPKEQIKSHWQHYFDKQAISTTEFYSRVRVGLMERKISIRVSEATMKQTHALSDSRLYLRVQDHEHVFYVCVAPYGTGTFASWWLCETEEGFMNRIPFISRMFGKDRRNKTLYQLDTEGMCKSAIHSTVLSVVDSYANTSGMRALSETERQYSDKQYSGRIQ